MVRNLDKVRNKTKFINNEKRWDVRQAYAMHKGEIDAMARTLGILPKTAVLLYNRGLCDAESASRFLKKETELFYDPFMLSDMDKAVSRIIEARKKGEKIVIYGDYDVDGVTSTASLYLYLKSIGADVRYYIPSRSGEGYGINTTALEGFASDGVNLIVTVDTGITAAKEIEYAASLGLSVIVTDHHECHNGIPEAAVAVVNPRREGDSYPFKELAGVGVVFKLLCALETRRQNGRAMDALREICTRYGDMVAIGTVADVMPLIDENRLIVSIGLNLIENTERAGLVALIEQAGAGDNSNPKAPKKKRKVTSSLIGYTLAPRINAAGRISNASKAVELFLTESPFRASQLASELCDINRKRQDEENSIIAEAYANLDATHDFDNDPVIVLDSDSWHHGVIGIVASRITEHYNLPSLLISFEGDLGKGSGRSVKGLNLVEALKECGDCLVKFGGHELAAGLSIERSKLDEFKKRINDYAREKLRDEELTTTLDIDCELEASDLTLEAASQLYLLEPYGIANPVPVFVLRSAVIAEVLPIGGGRHTRLTIDKNGMFFTAVAFGMPADEIGIAEGESADIVFNLDINDFRGTRTVQLIVRDIRPSEDVLRELATKAKSYEAMEHDEAVLREFLPVRDDFVKVYTYLRDSIRDGRENFTYSELEKQTAAPQNCHLATPYLRMHMVLDILREMEIIEADEMSAMCGKVRVRLSNVKNKINLDKSEIFRRMKAKAVDVIQ